MNEKHAFGTRLKESRKVAHLTQKQVAESIGIAQGTLSELEAGKHSSTASVPLLANLYRVSSLWLATGKGPRSAGHGGADEAAPTEGREGSADNRLFSLRTPGTDELGTRAIPLINQAQVNDFYQESAARMGDAVEYLVPSLKFSTRGFALRIEDESMLPEFSIGDIVLIDPLVKPQPGAYVIASDGADGVTFRKFKSNGVDRSGHELFELIPLNQFFPTLRSEQSALIIIGTVREHRRFFS